MKTKVRFEGTKIGSIDAYINTGFHESGAITSNDILAIIIVESEGEPYITTKRLSELIPITKLEYKNMLNQKDFY